MASTAPKLLSVLFLILALSLQIHAREFFSKVSSSNTNNNAKETTIPNEQPENQKSELPNKEEQQYVTKQQQEPTFIPQTEKQNGYGLYGHESGQYPSETTTAAATTTTKKVTYEPYVTPIRSGTFENYPNNNNNYYNSNANYENEQKQNLGGERFAESDSYRTTATNDNGYGYNSNAAATTTNKVTYEPYVTPIRPGTFENYPSKNNYNNNANYENEQKQNLGGARFAESDNYRTTATNDNDNRYNSNVERQGMSDTRFMENGKYFYDVQNENNYYQNQQYQNSRVGSRNGQYMNYNTRGTGYNGNNAISYNPMNEEEFDEVFEP